MKRIDARRNRERILDASSAVFAQYGIDVQMTDIAAAADVGIATLYRNFPTKEELVKTLLTHHLTRLVEVARDATQEHEPWDALVRFLQWLTTLPVENRVLSQVLGVRLVDSSPELAAQRDELAAILTDLCDRAKAAGQLRRDTTPADVFAALRAVAQVSASDLHPRLVRRLAGLLLDGLQSPSERALEGPPVSDEESAAYEAMLLRRAQGRREARARPRPSRGATDGERAMDGGT